MRACGAACAKAARTIRESVHVPGACTGHPARCRTVGGPRPLPRGSIRCETRHAPCRVDRHAARWYGRRVRLAIVLLVVVFLTPLVRAEDPDEEPKSGLSRRLRTIDDSAEFEADHPERAGDDPGDVAEEPDDPTAAPFDEGDPAAAPARGRRAPTPGETPR